VGGRTDQPHRHRRLTGRCRSPARLSVMGFAPRVKPLEHGVVRRLLCHLLMLASAVAVVGCTGGSPSSTAGLTARAPKPCAAESFHLRQVTRVNTGHASSVVGGHLPSRLPHGFGLQEVDRVEPGHLGYVAWTDDACRRVAVLFAPGVSSISGPAVHAFGPWMKLQGCGEPRPCVVYEGGVSGGLVTFSTWGLEPKIAADLLHTVSAGGTSVSP
jgi:hypothetical protein